MQPVKRNIVIRQILLTLSITLAAALTMGCNGKQTSEETSSDSTHTRKYIVQIHTKQPNLALRILDTMETRKEMESYNADYIRMAIYHNVLSQRRLSRFHCLRAVNNPDFKKKNKEDYCDALRMLAELDYKESRYSSSINYAKKATDEARKRGNRQLENKMMHCVGRNTVKIGNPKAGYEMMWKATENSEKIFDENPDMYTADEVIFSFATILEMMLKEGKASDAIPHIHEMTRRMEKVEKSGLLPEYYMDTRKASIYAIIMNIYDKVGDIKSAEKYKKEFEKTNIGKSETGKINLVTHYLTSKQYSQLLKTTQAMRERIRVQMQDSITSEYLTNILVNEFEAYKAMGNERMARLTAEAMLTIRDSIDKRTQENDVMQLAKIYETQEKDLKLADQDRLLARQKLVMYAFIGLLIIAAVTIALMIYYNKKINRRSKAAVATISQLVEQQDELSKLRPNNITDGNTDNFVKEISMNQSVNMLKRDDCNSIEEVAKRCGFKDEKTFTRLFESHYGLTPSEYMHWNKLANKKKDNSSDMKTSFIRNMSHEIRTPLNQISGFVQLLTDPNVKLEDSQKKEFNDIIVDQTRHMTKMLNDLIEISEYESDKSRLPTSDITVNSIFTSVMELHAEAKPGVQLIYETVDDNIVITSNHDAIVRILSCLVDNAIKNTDSGFVKVAFSPASSGGVFSVTDTGRGIPTDKAETIFERFYKLDSFTPGVGLGLTLSRAIAKRIGARVSLDTNYSAGARFTIEL